MRATFEERTLTVRSYLRTYEIRLDDHVVTFADVPYQGWSSGYAPLYVGGPLGLWQVDIVYVVSGRPTSLPFTMCTRRRCQRIVESLNGMLPDDPSGRTWRVETLPQHSPRVQWTLLSSTTAFRRERGLCSCAA